MAKRSEGAEARPVFPGAATAGSEEACERSCQSVQRAVGDAEPAEQRDQQSAPATDEGDEESAGPSTHLQHERRRAGGGGFGRLVPRRSWLM